MHGSHLSITRILHYNARRHIGLFVDDVFHGNSEVFLKICMMHVAVNLRIPHSSAHCGAAYKK